MALINHPFEFKTRWRDIEVDKRDPVYTQLLEERDRDLEDFLATLGNGGIASALRRTSTQTFNSGSAVVINMSTTDYLNGMTASSGRLVCATAGVWDLTGYAQFNVGVGGDPLALALQVIRSAVAVEHIDSGQLPIAVGAAGYANLTMDAALQVGDIVQLVIYETSGAGVVKGSIITSSAPARLSAHLIG